jgi:hypothetical protein
MQARWFDKKGAVDEAKVRRARDIEELLTPSAERARLLNKAYRSIVIAQSFLQGRDATVSPPKNVFREVNAEQVPLPPERQFKWDIRLDWSSVSGAPPDSGRRMVVGLR